MNISKNYVLGVDPGANGALALYNVNDGLILNVWRMPNEEIILTNKKKTKRVDILKLWKLYNLVYENVNSKNGVLHIHIEKVQAFGKESAPAAFNFGYAAAIPAALSYALKLTPILVHPTIWKRNIGLQASDKDESRLLAIKLFPELAVLLKYKKDVDLADAIHIAMYIP
jgi:hypothetical protein